MPGPPRRRRMSSAGARAAFAASVAAMLMALGLAGGTAHGTDTEVDVRIAAQRLENERIEFALQRRLAGGEWSERILPARRFFPATAAPGRWLTSSPLTVRPEGGGEAEVRIAAQRLQSGRTEFALQQRVAGGEWSERILPARRFFPAAATPGRWLSSSPLAIAAARPPRTLPDTRGLQWLRGTHPDLYRQLQVLPWPGQHFTEPELEALEHVVDLAGRDAGAAAAVMALPWFADGVTEAEVAALKQVSRIASEGDERGGATGAAIVALAWFRDGIAEPEGTALEWTRWLNRLSDASAADLVTLPWFQDGITHDEAGLVERFYWTARVDPSLADGLLATSWFQDGITRDEAGLVERFYRAATGAPALAQSLLAKSWFQDGITRDEAAVVDRLASTVRAEDDDLQPQVVQAAIEILAMPFLDTVESPDAMAVNSLERFEDAGSAGFLELMTHPKISDGIDDEEARIITVLGETNEHMPQLVPVLLDGTHVFTEERTVDLPHSGEVLLAVIRFNNHTGPNLDYLEHAIRHHEGFMGAALPTNYIAWYFADYVSAGWHAGTHIASSPGRDPDPAVSEYWRAPRHAAHESGHYYWTSRGSRGIQDWIVEGAADMLVILSEHARVGRPVVHNRDQCLPFTTIGELEAASVDEDYDGSSCEYSLGQRLFVDLYHVLGEDAFQQGFRSLYSKRLRDDPADGCEGTGLGICHVEASFKAGQPDEVLGRVDEVIGHWYYGRTATHEADRAQLVALYHEMGGSRWVDSTNWLSDAHIGEWYGVATDAAGRVIELNLAENGVTGLLSSGLGNLSNLREFLLNRNELTGAIPSSLGNLTNLTRLELDDNELTGPIPSSLGSLINLTRLELDDNDLTGPIPSSLGNLINLTRLELDDNELTGALPSSLGNLTNALRYLRLAGGNRFAGCVPAGLSSVADNDLAELGLPSCR